jgi:hypothetical protein
MHHPNIKRNTSRLLVGTGVKFRQQLRSNGFENENNMTTLPLRSQEHYAQMRLDLEDEGLPLQMLSRNIGGPRTMHFENFVLVG